MSGSEFCPHGYSSQYVCWRCQQELLGRTKQGRMWLQEQPQTTPKQQDGPERLLSRFHSLLGGDITETSTVTLRYVQIVVLNFLLLTTVNATGERATSVSLTLAMPRGSWLQISRYRRDSSKSQSHTECNRAIPKILNLPENMTVDTSNPNQWTVRPMQGRKWWHFLTQG